MVDTLTSAQRLLAMRAVKSHNTSIEVEFRKALHARGFRYSLHVKRLPGRPDIALPRHRAVVFVHGCFWHGHECARGARLPKTNIDYWADRIARNRARDIAAARALIASDWRVAIVWACTLTDIDRTATIVQGWLTSSKDILQLEVGGDVSSSK